MNRRNNKVKSRRLKEWERILARFKRLDYKLGIELLEKLIEGQTEIDKKETESRQ